MENSETSDNNIKCKNVTTQIDIQTTEDETLKVRLNKDHVLVVNKKKLLEKSHYFKLITNSCFADHKSQFIEVSIPVSFESFKKVICYVITDVININNDTLFEVFQISDYLQIETLSKMCFDTYTYNLNIKTLDHQLSLMEKYPIMLCNDFKEVALKFKESGRPSVKGFYLLLSSEPDVLLQLIGGENDSVITIGKNVFHKHEFLYFFSNSLIMLNRKTYTLIQYDLITGILVDIELKNNMDTTICSDNNNVFVITPVEDMTTNKVLLSVLRKNSDKVLKVYKTEIFSFSNLTKSNLDNLLNLHIKFSFCGDGKLYIFYTLWFRSGNRLKTVLDFLHMVHIVTICINTMTIISTQILTDCITYGTGGVMTQKESIEKINLRCQRFVMLFFLKKAQKCVIEVDKHLHLVCDIKNNTFYLVEDMIPYSKYCPVINIRYTVDNDDLVFMYTIENLNIGVTDKKQIRTFQYYNDKLVDVGTKWEESLNSMDKCVGSICIV